MSKCRFVVTCLAGPNFVVTFFKEDFTMDIDFVVSSNRVKVKIKGVVCFEPNIHKINW